MNVLFCRFCAERKQINELFDLSSNIPLRQEITECVSFFAQNAVDFTDRSLPETVCVTCHGALRVCCIFLNKIRQSQNVLRHLRDFTNKGEKVDNSVEKSTLTRIKTESSSDSENCDENTSFYGQKDYNFEVAIEPTIIVEQFGVVKAEVEENPLNVDVKHEENAAYVSSHGAEPSHPQTESKKIKIKKINKKTYECTACGDFFPTWKELLKHTSTDNDHVPIKRQREKLIAEECKVCHRVIHGRGNINRHKLLHMKRTRDFKCDECDKCFFTESVLQHHKATHRSDPQVCKICGKVFQNIARLRYHAKTHIVKRFECDICHRVFTAKAKISSHMQIHTNNFTFLCNICGKSFRFKANLKSHENVHKEVKPYSCTACDKKFTMWSNCNKHMKRIHGRSFAKNVMTPLGKLPIDQATGVPIQLKSKSLNHNIKLDLVNETDNGEKAIFDCAGCVSKFPTKAMLEQHTRIAHGRYEAQVCRICNAKLANWQSLRKHMKKHDGKTYECDLCHRMFETKSNIRSHMIVHIDIKPFHCVHCGKSFKRNTHLKLHMGIHGFKV